MLIWLGKGVFLLVLGKVVHWHVTKKKDDDDDGDGDGSTGGCAQSGSNYRSMLRVTYSEMYASCLGQYIF